MIKECDYCKKEIDLDKNPWVFVNDLFYHSSCFNKKERLSNSDNIGG